MMDTSSINRLLVQTDRKTVFRSGDPSDLRLGDLIADVGELGSQSVRCVIVGVPQHIGVERNGGRPGAAEAPSTIRASLYRMGTSAVSKSITEGRLGLADIGDIRVDGRSLEEIHEAQHEVVAAVLNSGAIPIVIGGGHDTAWPTIDALNAVGVEYGVINIDAHADVRPFKNGLAHSGSPFRQMIEAKNSCLKEGGFVEFGLQHNAVSIDHLEFIQASGHHAIMLDDVMGQGVASSWSSALARVKETDLYLTLDMDGIASAFAPGVSAPSSTGFSANDVAYCLRSAARDTSLRAFDVVEVSPPFDVDGRTSKLASTMIMNVLAGLADKL